MRLSRLSAYIFRYFLRFFVSGLGLCVGLFVLIETFDRLDEFLEPQVVWRDVAIYLLARLPGIIYQMTPAACLLASVLTFSTLSKSQEITAMRAAGVAPLRLARPLAGFGALACLAMLAGQLAWVPAATQHANWLWRTRIHPTQQAAQEVQRWYRYEQRVWHSTHTLAEDACLLGVTLYILDTQGGIQQRYDAARACQEGQGWVFYEGVVRTFAGSALGQTRTEPFHTKRVAFPERWQTLPSQQPEEMGLLTLWALTRRQHHNPLYLTELHGKIAFAAVCLLMAASGAPLALHVNRQGGSMRAVGLTFLGGFSYWMLHSLAMAFGANGYWPPLLAAWSANGCLGLGSLYLAWRLR